MHVMLPTKPFNGIRATLCALKLVLFLEFSIFGTHVFKSFKNEIFGLERVNPVLFFMYMVIR